MRDKFLTLTEEMTFRDWSMLCVLVTTVIIMWWRVGSNIRDVIYIRRFRAQRGRQYVSGAWGARQNSLITLLVAETLVAVAISILIALMLVGVTL
ncbi:hypothetical protein [Pantoea phytobeneficialis]|uniref:Uncharacterized protein n=1 Tax=Pantoea phytobeneficialis TaxID=2052056 RepID=A0AAP9HAQ8_9GAMM|nr:hypothetical protein [Pantoea phytobeneficialis]MDO6406558.1 hypothetical protein [Pantoea phytobeneficialis]QGR09651.1 hypothetical protein CTZ24_24630 [Pantoea phytobeneficialis]